MLTAMLAKGHILIEDVSGVGKTTNVLILRRRICIHTKQRS